MKVAKLDLKQEEALLAKLAGFVVRRRLTAPAILMLEMHRPLNFVASQVLVMFEPFLTFFFRPEEIQALIRILEDRGGLERLILAIEDLEAANATLPAKEPLK